MTARQATKIRVVILVLTLAGLVAAALAYLVYSGNEGYCIVGGEGGTILPVEVIGSEGGGGLSGCELLYSLPQARILGFHLSELAPPYFVVLTVLAVLWILREDRAFPAALLGGYVIGAALVPYLVYLEYVAETICLYCTVMHAVILVNTGLTAYTLYRG